MATSNPVSDDTSDPKQLVPDSVGTKQLNQMHLIDLFFFSYRDFTAEADRKLMHMDYGRAHHRTLYFINRKPGMMVAELLDILAITKQSLSRVLRQLIDNGYITQREGENDRRQRLLYPTRNGRELLLSLSKPQSKRIESALGAVEKLVNSTDDTIDHNQLITTFLEAMIDPENKRHMEKLP